MIAIYIAAIVVVSAATSVAVIAIERHYRRPQGHTAAQRCTATRIYDFTGTKSFKCRLMHGRKARCNLTEDHSDGSLYIHWDPVWKSWWTSGPEVFK